VRRLIVLLLPIVLGIGLWVVARGESSVPASSWTVCAPDETACIKNALDAEIDARGVVEVAESVLQVFSGDPGRRPGCHALMHEIGQLLAEREESPQLEDRWSTCGYGLLHGVYETLPLPDTPEKAGQSAYKRCRENPEVAENRDLLARCEHALGHSLWRNFDGDLDRSVQGCLVETDRAIYENCLSGVYMMDKNENWADKPAPRDAAAWRAALAGCDDRTAVACILAHAETAVFDSAASARGWLEVCLEQAGADVRGRLQIGKRCIYLLGQSQAFEENQDSNPTGRIADCVTWTGELLPEAREACRDGALNALAALGIGEKERHERLCAALKETDLAC
jgi:hypothetical protein